MGPLEETAKKQKQINSLAHNVDNERERTFALAGSVDAQIKALALELREASVYHNLAAALFVYSHFSRRFFLRRKVVAALRAFSCVVTHALGKWTLCVNAIVNVCL